MLIAFYCGVRKIGHVRCSSFTFGLQEQEYGSSWFDCLTYNAPDGEEAIGPPDSEDLGGFFVPDWDRGVERAGKLLEIARVSEKRSSKDAPFFTELTRLLKACSESPLREYCRVKVFE